MEGSKLRFYLSLIIGGVFLFVLGYYFGLSDTRTSSVIQNAENRRDEEDKKLSLAMIDKVSATQSVFEESLDKQASLALEEEILSSRTPGIRQIFEEFAAESNPVYKISRLAEAMKQLNEDNLEETLEVFESIPFGFENAQEYKMLLYAWSQFDPYGAIDYCKQRSSGIGSGFAISGVLEGWAASNSEDARQWVERPDNQGMAKLYNFGLVKGWASNDLNGASEYVMNMKGGDEVGKLAGIIAEQYNKRGFEDASRWAENIENPKLKEAAFSKLSRSLARDKPEQMASWLTEHTDGKYAVKAFENLGSKWSETDPESAINYFSDLPEGKVQEVGVKSVIGNWAKQDPLAAGNWLNDQSPSPRLDSALANYATTVSLDDGASAMDWAVSISEDKLQQKTVRQVGWEWYRQDKDAVEEWLPQSGLSEDLQNSIRKPPKKNWWQSLRDL
jgi:hypothetical protein